MATLKLLITVYGRRWGLFSTPFTGGLWPLKCLLAYVALTFCVAPSWAQDSDPLILRSGTNFDAAYIGISAQTCRDIDGSHMAKVTGVRKEDSPFYGLLQVGDLILIFNDVRILNASMLMRLIQDTAPNSEIELTIVRDRRSIEIKGQAGTDRKAARFHGDPPINLPAC